MNFLVVLGYNFEVILFDFCFDGFCLLFILFDIILGIMVSVVNFLLLFIIFKDFY